MTPYYDADGIVLPDWVSLGVPCSHGYLGWHKMVDGVPPTICKEGQRRHVQTERLLWALGRADVDPRSTLYIPARLRDGTETLHLLLEGDQ